MKRASIELNVVKEGLVENNGLTGIRTETTILENNLCPTSFGEIVGGGITVLELTFVEQNGLEVGESEGPCVTLAHKLMIPDAEVVVVTLLD